MYACVCARALFITTVHYCNGFFLYMCCVHKRVFTIYLSLLPFIISFIFSSSHFHSFFSFFLHNILAFHFLLDFFCLFPSPIPHLFLSSLIPFSLLYFSFFYFLSISILTYPNYFLLSFFSFSFYPSYLFSLIFFLLT